MKVALAGTVCEPNFKDMDLEAALTLIKETANKHPQEKIYVQITVVA